ncbi:hypothetical protein BDZ45DRAFT_754328 [Acephala macrosclerotiorum]|nr:hypothetical protein BDZ45DRAFT_754328 [Acephala macrosclerotiorum]
MLLQRGQGIGRDCALAYAAAGVEGETGQEHRLTDHGARGRFLQEESVDRLVLEAVAEFGKVEVDSKANSAGLSALHIAFRGGHKTGQIQNYPKGVMDLGSSGVAASSMSALVIGMSHREELFNGHLRSMRQRNANAIPSLDKATHAIRDNAVLPSRVSGPIMDRAFEGSQVLKKTVPKSISLGRLVFPEEMSEIILFLSSSGASFVTGVGWIVGDGTTWQTQT